MINKEHRQFKNKETWQLNAICDICDHGLGSIQTFSFYIKNTSRIKKLE